MVLRNFLMVIYSLGIIVTENLMDMVIFALSNSKGEYLWSNGSTYKGDFI
jgi:hypothetical protein